MVEPIELGGRRALHGVVDRATGASHLVVACPPHPALGGSRTDRRLRAVGDGLVDSGIDCLRFDYGPWDGGPGERDDTVDAIGWGLDRYDAVGVFGFSFGGSMAILAGATTGADLVGISALAPSIGVAQDSDLDVLEAFQRLPCAVQIIYGERDETAQWAPLVDAARERGCEVVSMSADHFFVGQHDTVAASVSSFFEQAFSSY